MTGSAQVDQARTVSEAREFVNQQRLFAERTRRNASMPPVYKTDQWVAKRLEAVEKQHANVAVYWSTGMRHGATAISAYDAKFIQLMLSDPHNDVTRVIVPENSGGHWTLTVLQKDSYTGEMSSHHIATRADGTCGDSLVEEAAAVAAVSDTAFKSEISKRQRQAGYVGRAALQAPTTVPGVELEVNVGVQQEVVVQPIKAAVTQSDAVSEGTFTSVVTPQLIKEAREAATVDYYLVRLAEADHEGDSTKVQHYQSALVNIYTKMGAAEKAEAVTRLVDSGLADKSSVAAVIDAVIGHGPEQDRKSVV